MALAGIHGWKLKSLNAGKSNVMVFFNLKSGVRSFLFLFSLFPFLGSAQETSSIKISGLRLSEEQRYVEIGIKAMDGSKPAELDSEAKGIQVFEMADDGTLRETRIEGSIKKSVVRQQVSTKKDTFTLFFLLECAAGLNDKDFNAAKGMVRDILTSLNLQRPSVAFIAGYGNSLSEPTEIGLSNMEEALAKFSLKNENPDFYRILSDAIRLVDLPRKFTGKKLLFVLSSGKNNTEGSSFYSRGRIPLNPSDIETQISKIQDDVYIFPISITPDSDISFLSQLVESSPQQKDRLEAGKVTEGLQEILKGESVILQTHTLKVTPNQKVYIGKKNTYVLRSYDQEIDRYVKEPGFGSLNNPIVLKSLSSINLLLYGALGLLIVLGVLGIFSFLLPYFRQTKFKREHVISYIEDLNRRIFDPVTRLPLKQGDMVVKVCAQTIPFETWKGMGWQCPEFPDCLQNPQMRCNGKGAPMDNKGFFSMRGDFKKLNWFWFGLVGGYLSWCLFAILKILDFEWYKSTLQKLYQSYYQINTNLDKGLNLDEVVNGAIIGGAFGFGLLLLLSWVEERGQSRKLSIGRILLRTMVGTILCGVVSILLFILQFQGVVVQVHLISLLNWVLLGLSIGLILSVSSSILTARGLMGGLLSGMAGFAIYVGFSMLIKDYYTAKLFSLTTMGGLLGLFVVTVSEKIEDFELEFISPREFQRVVPISKWLKSGVEVEIGNQQGAYVYIKWPDSAVLPKHGTLRYENGFVFLSPIGEILLNGELIGKSNKVRLRNGDIIKLGKEGGTQLRYKEKVKPG